MFSVFTDFTVFKHKLLIFINC